MKKFEDCTALKVEFATQTDADGMYDVLGDLIKNDRLPMHETVDFIYYVAYENETEMAQIRSLAEEVCEDGNTLEISSCTYRFHEFFVIGDAIEGK